MERLKEGDATRKPSDQNKARGELMSFVRNLLRQGKIGLKNPLVLALFDEKIRSVFREYLWSEGGKTPEQIQEDHRVADIIENNDGFHSLTSEEEEQLENLIYRAEQEGSLSPELNLLRGETRIWVQLRVQPEQVERLEEYSFMATLDARYAKKNAKALEDQIPGCQITIKFGDADRSRLGVQKMGRDAAEEKQRQEDLESARARRFNSQVKVTGMPRGIFLANPERLIWRLNLES